MYVKEVKFLLGLSFVVGSLFVFLNAAGAFHSAFHKEYRDWKNMAAKW